MNITEYFFNAIQNLATYGICGQLYELYVFVSQVKDH